MSSKPDGRYQPWFARNPALLRPRHPKPEKIRASFALRAVMAYWPRGWNRMPAVVLLLRVCGKDGFLRAHRVGESLTATYPSPLGPTTATS